MRMLAFTAALLALSAASFAAYESSMGIHVIPAHSHPGKPVNFKFAYDFSHGTDSFGGTWKAIAGGGKGDGASIGPCQGYDGRDDGMRFDFHLPPGGDTWALLHFTPGRFSRIEMTPEDGIFLRARTTGAEMDGYPARWYMQLRVLDEGGNVRVFRTPDFEVLEIWQTFWISAWDFGDASSAGLFANGRERARIFDLSLIPNVEKYRDGALLVDALTVWCPGRKLPGLDTDGDGVPDFVDGDDDNDGVLDFAQAREGGMVFRRQGFLQSGGRWEGRFSLKEAWIERGGTLAVDVDVHVESREVARTLDQVPEMVGLLVGERKHDKEGWWHAFSNHMISSFLTPTGFPVENYQNLVPTRHAVSSSGTPYTSPIDAISRVPRTKIRKGTGEIFVSFRFRVPITSGIPEGHWWLYFEFGVLDKAGNFLRLGSLPSVARAEGIGDTSAYGVDYAENLVFEKKCILPMIRIGNPAPPRLPWTLFGDVEVHGVRGIVPDQARGQWALNARNRLEAEPIYPPGRYNLEPGLPSIAYPSLNIRYPLNPRSGEVSVQVTDPDGKTVDLGTHALKALTTWGATTRTGDLMVDFKKYGQYRVRMTGWILDVYGNRFEGGGTYRFWIARRITFGTFPSLPYEVGQTFHGAMEVVPPVPADIELTIEFYPHSDPAKKEIFKTETKANRLGLFVAEDKYVFEEPGEYVSRVWGKYRDADGTLWLGSLWGAMVVAEPDTPMVAHGRTGYMLNGLGLPTPARFALKEEGSIEEGKTHFLFYPTTTATSSTSPPPSTTTTTSTPSSPWNVPTISAPTAASAPDGASIPSSPPPRRDGRPSASPRTSTASPTSTPMDGDPASADATSSEAHRS